MYKFIFLAILGLSVSCKKEVDQQEFEKYMDQKVDAYSDLIGHKLICAHRSGEAHLFMYSPHVIGIWSTDKTFMTEYYRTVNVDDKKKEVFYEALLSGTWDLKTKLKQPDNSGNRRIKLQIDEVGSVIVTVVERLDPSTRDPINPQAYECARGPKIEHYWATDAIKDEQSKAKN